MAGQTQNLPETRVAWNDKRSVWEVRWTEQGDNGRPRSRAVSTGVKDAGGKSQAKIFEAEWRAQQAGIEIALGEPVIDTLIDLYLEDALSRGFLKRNVSQFNPIREAFGPRRLSTITKQDFLDYVSETSERVKLSTIRCHLQRLRTVIRYAHKSGALSRDIDPLIPIPPEQQGRVVFLDESDEREFHALACGLSIGKDLLDEVTLFTCIGLDTGARYAAIAGLTWDRVDLEGRTIDFREAGRFVKKKRRAISPINSRLLPVLDRARREKSGQRLFPFPSRLEKKFREFARDVGFEWVTPHVLRHTFATLLLKEGVDIVQVAELLADTPETVLKTYAHVTKAWLRDAAEARLRKFMS